jgi:hypothetical protein
MMLAVWDRPEWKGLCSASAASSLFLVLWFLTTVSGALWYTMAVSQDYLGTYNHRYVLFSNIYAQKCKNSIINLLHCNFLSHALSMAVIQAINSTNSFSI